MDPGTRQASSFPVTRWSAVLAVGPDDARGRAALTWLCERYWEPLRRHARRRGCGEDEAQDLVQGFFARLLERRDLAADPARGRFRAYLLGALNHHLAHERERARTLKRGGDRHQVALDAATEPAAAAPPDHDFDREWASALLARVLDRLEREHDGPLAARFAALRPFLVANGDAGAYAATGARLGLGEGAVKVAVHRLRARYRDLLRAEVAETLADPGDVRAVDAEIADLLAALRA